uniref:Uncharacterized protein n=1 Tax=Aegilops tauschii subsp. strangulata TaxID=200361 RepID=A0A453BJP9_AEGTS
LSCSLIVDLSTNKLGFTPGFLGRVKLVTSIASLLGVGIYNYFLKAVHLRKIFLVTTIIGSALGMTQVFILLLFQCSGSYFASFQVKTLVCCMSSRFFLSLGLIGSLGSVMSGSPLEIR